jgi:signal peptidase II
MLMGPAGEIPLFGDWFKLHYTLNPGMAFGVELGSVYGKLILTIFRLFAMTGISYYLWVLWKRHAPAGLLWCGGLILGGAIGNLIDSLFYGILYGNAPFGAPMRAFYGQVIDMFYLDLYQGTLPYAWPIVGGASLSLWPIFNIADAAIFCGVAFILLNQQRFFPHGHIAVEGEEPVETAS